MLPINVAASVSCERDADCLGLPSSYGISDTAPHTYQLPAYCLFLLGGLVVGIRGDWHFGGGLAADRDIGLLVAILPRMAFEDGSRSTISPQCVSEYPLRIVSGGHFADSPVNKNSWIIINKMGANTDYGIVPYK